MSKQTDRLQLLISNLSKDFSLDKLSKSPARFSLQKLNWFNRQYIQMLSLEEFCLLAYKNRIDTSFKISDERKYRVGDYVYFIDHETQEIYGETGDCISGQDGLLYPIGGGRENLTWQEGLQKEVMEETNNQVHLNMDKVLKIGSFRVLSPKPFITEDGEYDGKEMHIYYYPIAKNQLESTEALDGFGEERKVWLFNWYNLDYYLVRNDFLGYPIYRKFALENGIKLEQSKEVEKAYLAWFLDKQRATVLSEFGLESDCILNWKKPKSEDLKWKKISLEQSLENLAKITEFIEESYSLQEFQDLQKNLYESIFSKDLVSIFTDITSFWEAKIKNWLTENNYPAGDFLWPLRVALSGKVKSASPFEILSILEKEEAVGRIREFVGVKQDK